MSYALALITKLFAIILISIVGYYIGKRNILKENAINVTSAILNNIALPTMIIASYIGIKLTKETIINSVYIIIAALVIYLINLIYVKVIVKKINLNPKQESVYINGALHANTGFLAFPLLLAVFGKIGLFYGTMFFMIDNILLFSKGIGRLKQGNKGQAKLAPVTISLIIAIALMVIANIFNLDLTNNFVYDAIHEISQITIPLAFLFIGMIISQQKIKELIFNRIAVLLVSIKLILIPILGILFFYFIDLNLDSMIIIIIMVELLMPVFASLIPLSHQYEKDTSLAASLVVISHLMAIITIPVLFTIVILIFDK